MDVSPYVRIVKIQESSYLGSWIDYDNVFTYINKGKADFIIEGKRFHLKEGNAIIIPPFAKHIISSSSSEFVEMIFHFDLKFNEKRTKLSEIGLKEYKGINYDEIPEKEKIFKTVFPVAKISNMDRIKLKEEFKLMYREFEVKSPGYQIMIKGIAIKILAIFLKNLEKTDNVNISSTKSWAHIEKTLNYINNNYYINTLDNKFISDHVGISKNYLMQIFKEEVGTTIHKYLNYVRISQAKKLLLDTNKNCTEIAFETGFSSIHIFSKVFKKLEGITPSQYIAINNSDKI